MFKLNWGDLAKGLFVAIGTPMFVALLHAMSVPGFDFIAFDWKSLIMLGVSAGVTYLVKNFFSDSTGKVFGRIG